MSLTKPIVVPFNYKPRDYQIPIFAAIDQGYKNILQVWPRQSGKDTTDFAVLVREAWRKPGNYFYIFPLKEMARKALWEKMMPGGMKLLDMIPKEILKRISNQEMTVELINGSTIRALGCDKDSDTIRGITPTGAVKSEDAFSDPSTYKALQPAIAMAGAWQIINSTPNGRNHFYKEALFAAESDDWFYSFYQSLWPDKEGYIKPLVELNFPGMVKQGLMEWEDIEREYGCSFATGLKGSYYSTLIDRARAENRIGYYPYDSNYPVHTFWDIGTSDYSSCWFIQYKQDGIFLIDYYEVQGPGTATDELVKVLSKKPYEYGTHYLPHDAGYPRQGRQIITTQGEFEESCKAFSISYDTEVIDKPKTKQTGISAVRRRFCRYHFNEPMVGKGLKHLDLYHKKFDKARQVYLNDPVHDEHSHCADALRLEAEADIEMMRYEKKIELVTEYDIWRL